MYSDLRPEDRSEGSVQGGIYSKYET